MPKVSEEHKEQRKHQILMAAMEVFKRKGYEKATLKDIVEETGMSRGWIYLYFTDKIEIFEALLLHLDEQIDEAFSPKKLEQMSIISILREFLESYKLIFTTIDESIYPAIYEFWISSWREPRAKTFFSHRYDKIVTLLSDLLHAGIEKEGFNPGAIFKSALNPDALIRELHEMNEILSRLISIQNKGEAEAIICASMNKRLKSPITRATVNMPLAFIPYTLLISTIHQDDPGALFHASMEGGSAAALTALSAAVRSAVYGSAVIPEILVRNLANRKKIMAIVDSLDNGSIPVALTDEFIQTEASLTRKELEELKAKQKHVKKKPKDKLSRTDKESRLSHYVVESWTKIDKAKWKKEQKKMDKKTRA